MPEFHSKGELRVYRAEGSRTVVIGATEDCGYINERYWSARASIPVCGGVPMGPEDAAIVAQVLRLRANTLRAQLERVDTTLRRLAARRSAKT